MSAHPPAAGRHPADEPERTPIAAGERGRARMPWSEGMLHLRLAGAVTAFEVTADSTAVQLLSGGHPYSIPVLPGEAGLYRHPDGGYWYHPEPDTTSAEPTA